jgi:integrase
MPKITKRTVRAARPTDRDYTIWDESLPRFGLRVRTSGTKTYVVQYRASARSRYLTLGRHGPLTPDHARKQALQALSEVEQGRDPASVRDASRTAPTVADLCSRYLQDHAQGRKKPSSLRDDRRMIDQLILPSLGCRKVEDINALDLTRLHNSLRSTPYQANRVLALLSKMFNLAERWKLRPDGSNPARHVDRFKEEKRERYLSEEELARLGDILAEFHRSGLASAYVVAAIRLLIFTGCRVGEILSIQWQDLDVERRLLRIPDSKTGSKTIPLNGPAFAVFAQVEHTESPWVLPGSRPGGHLVNLSKPWTAIRARAGLTDVRLHDLRHTFASVGAGAGFSLPTIGKLLGHTQPATTQRYAHLADDPVRQASETIAARIETAMNSVPVVVDS